MIPVRRNNAGVTLTELLVVLLIIAILGTIAVPVYLNRVETAKIRTAQMETRELAQAEEMVASIHGFYVPLQMLDDVSRPSADNAELDDSIQNEVSQNASDLYLYKVALPPTAQEANVNQPQLRDWVSGSANFDNDVNKMVTNWQGPFINFNRYFKGMNGTSQIIAAIDSDRDQVLRDYPLDPWGQPYRFYGPMGILGGTNADDTDVTRMDNDSTFNLEQNLNQSNERDPFDRFAIVSYGPNQQPNGLNSTPQNAGDDIIYLFGFVATETLYVP